MRWLHSTTGQLVLGQLLAGYPLLATVMITNGSRADACRTVAGGCVSPGWWTNAGCCCWLYLLIAVAGCCCWLLLLIAVAGCCCWLLLLIAAVDCCCWLLLLVAAVNCCCWLLLLVAAVDCCSAAKTNLQAKKSLNVFEEAMKKTGKDKFWNCFRIFSEQGLSSRSMTRGKWRRNSPRVIKPVDARKAND